MTLLSKSERFVRLDGDRVDFATSMADLDGLPMSSERGEKAYRLSANNISLERCLQFLTISVILAVILVATLIISVVVRVYDSSCWH